MESKLCICCKEIKNVEDFHKNKSKKDGLQDHCKICRKIKSEKNKEKRKEYRKEWYKKNSEHIKFLEKSRYHNNKENINKKRKNLYHTDTFIREKIREQHKKYYQNNKDFFKKVTKKWVEKNKEKRNQISRKHYEKYKTLMICRRLIKRTIKYLNTEKELSTIELLGYSPKLLKENIESKFLHGMSWENYGEWHIDHIKPISSFDKNEHPSVINSLDNLQPLWAFDNLSKGTKFDSYS